MASVLSLLALVTFIPKLLTAFINDKHFWQSNTRGENSCHGNAKQLQQPNIQGIAWCCYNELQRFSKVCQKSPSFRANIFCKSCNYTIAQQRKSYGLQLWIREGDLKGSMVPHLFNSSDKHTTRRKRIEDSKPCVTSMTIILFEITFH